MCPLYPLSSFLHKLSLEVALGVREYEPYYFACLQVVQDTMDRFEAIAGCQYHLFDYAGAPDAERVIVLMGSGAEAVQAAVDSLNARGEKVDVVRVHLFRPFSVEHLAAAIPKTARVIAMLDRTKESGSMGEPLYLGVVGALNEGKEETMACPAIIGRRYGLASKEFTPGDGKGHF